MKHWNYRVMAFTDSEGTTSYMVHEVYYGEDGRPEAYTEEGCRPYGESIEELRSDVEHMLEALKQPALSEKDFKKEKQ
jgi:hypothetical protein